MTVDHRTAAVTGRRGPALVVLCFVQFMLVLDDTVVNVALPSLQADLGFSTAGLTWVVNAYFLSFGGLLLLFGRAADRFGRRRVFLSGVVVFGAASLVCGIAQEPWQLVAGRFAQGAGAAMSAPAALALIALLFPGTGERARALGIWGGIAALGGTAGLVISGALTDLASWRWIFLINLPVAVAALALLPRLVAESRAGRGRLDVPGAVLGTGTLLSLVFGLLRVAESGWDVVAAGALALAAVLAVSFAVVESRTAEPLVPMAFLAHRVRAVANSASLLFSAAFFGMAFLLMLHLQTVLGYRPLTAGLAYLPYGAGILAGMWLSSRSVIRFGVGRSLAMSFLISAIGLVVLSGVAPGAAYATEVLPGLLITSIGCGLSHPALAVAAVSGTTERDAGLGSALLNCGQQIGGAVGLAVLVPLATGRGASGYSLALTAAAALLVVGAVLIAALLRKEHRA
ncbi:MFS transporter [Saccharopolyspora indica]|uniref:MFS transporter n=1 Tax=Saccharopolyspora indica TaxID=1229659 RepID=UPI0022EB8643|nr:MFS transporter [Saccharopolyspora indica]MDA3649153.1 MFS transporter [Saccharopolyspora indica]